MVEGMDHQNIRCATCFYWDVASDYRKSVPDYDPHNICNQVFGRCKRTGATMSDWSGRAHDDWCGDHAGLREMQEYFKRRKKDEVERFSKDTE